MQVCKDSRVLSVLVYESILVYNSKSYKLISFKSCILIRNKPFDMCAKFGEDRSISFQVMGRKAKALPTDGQMDGRTDGRTDVHCVLILTRQYILIQVVVRKN